LQFATIVDAAEEAIIGTHRDGTIFSWNASAERIFGYRAEEMIAHSIRRLIPPDQLADASDILQRLEQGERIEHYAAALLHKDGSTVDVTLTLSPLKNATGAFVGTSMTAHHTARPLEEAQEQQRLATLVEQQREWFRTILASVPGVVWEAWGTPDAANQQINFVSDYVETMLGYSVEEWLQTPNFWLTIVHPEDRDLAVQNAMAVYRQGKSTGSQFRWVRRDGRVIWVEAQSTVVRDDAGRPIGMRGVTMDITERKLAEQALREQREWFAVTLASIGDAVIATDAAGRIMFMNTMAETITGWQHDQAIGLDSTRVFQVLDTETRKPAVNPVARVIRDAAALGMDHSKTLIASDGTERPIDHSAAPIRGTDDSVIGVVLVFRDVTERKRAEIRQRFLVEASSMLVRSLDYEVTLQSVADIAISTLADGCVIDIVDEEGTPHRLVAAHHDPAKVELAYELQRRYPLVSREQRGALEVIRSGQSKIIPDFSDDLLVASAYDDDHLQILRSMELSSYMCVPLVARDHVLGALSFVSDTSRQHYNQDDLIVAEELARQAALAVDNARLYQEAQAALRARDDFLSIAAHELKNPLTSLLAYTQRLLRRANREQPYTLSERDHQGLQVVADQTKRLHALIEDLLNVGRLRAGRLVINRQVMDIGQFVRRVVTELEHVLETHTLSLTCSDHPLLINGDPQGLEEVLQNLLQNAIKYSPQGSHIDVQVTQQGDQVAIAVVDQGIGIPAEAQAHLFQPFYRAPSNTTSGIKGTGIGLYIVKEIVSLHGGSVAVGSEEGQGSTFTVHLPLHDAGFHQSPGGTGHTIE
jgi:PAS domain S-box-containing protein